MSQSCHRAYSLVARYVHPRTLNTSSGSAKLEPWQLLPRWKLLAYLAINPKSCFRWSPRTISPTAPWDSFNIREVSDMHPLIILIPTQPIGGRI